MQFNPILFRRKLDGIAIPYLERNSLILLYFTEEWKEPEKDIIYTEIQIAYDGIYLIYKKNKARLFLRNSNPSNYIFISTFTIDDTTLNIYTYYSTQSQNQIKYY
jgi:hypothetical protein